MSDEVHHCEEPCPHCGAEEVYWRECSDLLCNDGYIDDALDNEEDFLLEGNGFSLCQECKGAGVVHWCRACGKEIEYEQISTDDEEDFYDDFEDLTNY